MKQITIYLLSVILKNLLVDKGNICFNKSNNNKNKNKNKPIKQMIKKEEHECPSRNAVRYFMTRVHPNQLKRSLKN